MNTANSIDLPELLELSAFYIDTLYIVAYNICNYITTLNDLNSFLRIFPTNKYVLSKHQIWQLIARYMTVYVSHNQNIIIPMFGNMIHGEYVCLGKGSNKSYGCITDRISCYSEQCYKIKYIDDIRNLNTKIVNVLLVNTSCIINYTRNVVNGYYIKHPHGYGPEEGYKVHGHPRGQYLEYYYYKLRQARYYTNAGSYIQFDLGSFTHGPTVYQVSEYNRNNIQHGVSIEYDIKEPMLLTNKFYTLFPAYNGDKLYIGSSKETYTEYNNGKKHGWHIRYNKGLHIHYANHIMNGPYMKMRIINGNASYLWKYINYLQGIKHGIYYEVNQKRTRFIHKLYNNNKCVYHVEYWNGNMRQIKWSKRSENIFYYTFANIYDLYIKQYLEPSA